MEENKKILEEWNASIECFPKLNFDTAYVAIYYLIDEKYNIIPLRLLICNKDESGNILYI